MNISNVSLLYLLETYETEIKLPVEQLYIIFFIIQCPACQMHSKPFYSLFSPLYFNLMTCPFRSKITIDLHIYFFLSINCQDVVRK